jgi:hypothetical protein
MKRYTPSFENRVVVARSKTHPSSPYSSCHKLCEKHKVSCPNEDCRLWIDFPDDFNCANLSVKKNGKLIFQEIGKRLRLTPSRIKQIENSALKKMKIRGNKSLNIVD